MWVDFTTTRKWLLSDKKTLRGTYLFDVISSQSHNARYWGQKRELWRFANNREFKQDVITIRYISVPSFFQSISRKSIVSTQIYRRNSVFPQIASNWMLTSYCHDLSTHHYHVAWRPCFATQSSTWPTRSAFSTCVQYVSQKEGKAIELPFSFLRRRRNGKSL